MKPLKLFLFTFICLVLFLNSSFAESVKNSNIIIEGNKKISSNNNLIKLDVQGSEIDILKGLEDYISLFEVIILETSVREYNKNGPLFIDVINFLNEKDYSLYDIFDLKRLGLNHSFLVQFDAIFVRKDSSLLKLDFV